MVVGVDVRTSGIWQTNSTVIAGASGCIVVDPAYFPRELDELATLATSRGRAHVVVFTHGHWDHVNGWQHFPRADVWASESLVAAIQSGEEWAIRNLDNARSFDARWYVERPVPHRWPDALRSLGDGERIDLDGVALETALLPGHSEDGVALIVEHRWLLPGDYLSPCEIPFARDPSRYRATLLRLLTLLPDLDEVIPGHGSRMSSAAAIEIARADLVYIEALLSAAERDDVATALDLPLPRAADTPGMRDEHVSNCRHAGLQLPAS